MAQQKTDVSRLIERARTEDRAALEQLLESYRNYLRLLSGTWCGSSIQGKADRSDVVQETLIKAHRSFGQFRGQTEPELVGWLRRILANTLLDLARRYHGAGRQVSREQSLEQTLDSSSLALGQMIAAAGSSPSHGAQRRELAVVLADALADLSDEHRQVIMLRNVQELEWDEIAGRMDRSRGAVRMLWARALKQLRPRIEERL